MPINKGLDFNNKDKDFISFIISVFKLSIFEKIFTLKTKSFFFTNKSKQNLFFLLEKESKINVSNLLIKYPAVLVKENNIFIGIITDADFLKLTSK